MAAQAGLCLAWSETPEDMFCRVVAQVFGVLGRILKLIVLVPDHCSFIYSPEVVSGLSGQM